MPVVKPKALFGEYKCTACGRSWTSRLSWTNTYNLCNRCKKPVYPFNQVKYVQVLTGIINTNFERTLLLEFGCNLELLYTGLLLTTISVLMVQYNHVMNSFIFMFLLRLRHSTVMFDLCTSY